MKLESLNQFLADDFEHINSIIADALHSETELTQTVGDYLRNTPSKRLRAAMVLLSAKACGYQGSHGPSAAAGIELIHAATLLHDDVIDKATTRRGRPSINARWNDSVAILMADFLYSKGFDLLLLAIKPDVMRLITQVTSRMCEGEMFQIQHENELLTEDDYLHIIRCKTAYLFSASMSFGSQLAEPSPEIVQRLAEFGMNFGIAFQITDDTLDFTASDSHWGKGIGTDIAGGKQTLPLIRTLEVASPGDREALINCLNNGREFKEIIHHIKEYNGIDYALGVARDYAVRARDSINVLPPSESKDYISWLADFVIDRQY